MSDDPGLSVSVTWAGTGITTALPASTPTWPSTPGPALGSVVIRNPKEALQAAKRVRREGVPHGLLADAPLGCTVYVYADTLPWDYEEGIVMTITERSDPDEDYRNPEPVLHRSVRVMHNGVAIAIGDTHGPWAVIRTDRAPDDPDDPIYEAIIEAERREQFRARD